MKPDVKYLKLPPLADHWVAVDGDELARLLQMPGKEAFDEDMLARLGEMKKQFFARRK